MLLVNDFFCGLWGENSKGMYQYCRVSAMFLSYYVRANFLPSFMRNEAKLGLDISSTF
jgi:hypothetical protein